MCVCVCGWMYARVNNYEVWSINIIKIRERNTSLQYRYMSIDVCVGLSYQSEHVCVCVHSYMYIILFIGNIAN